MARRILLIFFVLTAWSCGGGGGGDSTPQLFEFVIENLPGSQIPTSGVPAATVLSPGVFAVHEGGEPIYSVGRPAGTNGLETLAEDGNGTDLVESLEFVTGVRLIGLLQTPVGTESAALLAPGQSYRAVLRASPGQRLSAAFSFLQANDLVLATPAEGIALFDADGNPAGGDVTGSFALIDAGTEVNQPPGLGSDQGLRQAADNTGAAESVPVSPVADGFSYPAIGAMFRVTISPQ